MSGALEGVKVLDIAQAAAGPLGAMLLAEMGADVIKVEPPWGDFVRNRPPHKNGVDLMVSGFSRSKRSVVLDLKLERDREVIFELVKWADVFVENYKVGTADKLGLGYEALSAMNPGLIYVSVAGFGHYGPWREKGTMANIAAAFAGWGSLSGQPGDTPVGAKGGLSPDTVTPLYTSFAVLQALYHRELTGVGQKIETSQTEAGLGFLQSPATEYLMTGQQPQPLGSANANIVPSQVFATADGYVAVEAPNDRVWKRLCRALGIPDLARDARFATNPLRVQHRDALVPQLAATFATRPTSWWIAALTKERVPCDRLAASLDDLYADPQVQANALITDMELRGAGWLKTTCVPWEFSETPGEIKHLAPALGEHTREIFEQFGFTPDDEQDPAAARSARTGRR